MKRFSLLLILLTILTLNVKSQNISADQPSRAIISYKSIYFSPQFYHLGNQIRLKEVSNLLSTDAEADNLMKTGRTIHTFTYIMAGSGGFILGYNMNNPDPQLRRRNLTIGGALVGGAFITGLLGANKIKSSIDLYNTNITSQIHSDLSVSLGLCEFANGIGLKLSF